MILLADTNVIIDFWKAAPNEIIICGVVQSELLHRAYSEKNRREIHDTLKLFGTAELITRQ